MMCGPSPLEGRGQSRGALQGAGGGVPWRFGGRGLSVPWQAGLPWYTGQLLNGDRVTKASSWLISSKVSVR